MASPRTIRWRVVMAMSLLLIIAGLGGYHFARPIWNPIMVKLTGGRTVTEVMHTLGLEAEPRMQARFEQAHVAYPPKRIALIGLKHEGQLELWARADDDAAWSFVHTYLVLAASGVPGPKLREGDRQVPEGFYQIEALNPNSSYHLSMKLNYPNAFDLQHAHAEGRDQPGTNIFIHGSNQSIGCLAMGDPAIEELFTLVARIGKANAQVIIVPNDLRLSPPITDMATAPPWLADLYQQLQHTLEAFTHTASSD